MEKKVVAVVVTYNRLNMLKKNINCLLGQTIQLDKILIINNNSTDATKEYLKEIKEKYESKFIIVNLPENIGGAGGFSTGIEEASKIDDVDYIWGMDDDAFPQTDALEKLLEYAEPNKCLWSNCDNDTNFDNAEIKEVKRWMFVGFFIPKQIVEKIGYPRKDFFIYHDDSEYSKRIIENNYKIYKVKNSIINHKDTAKHMTKRIFGKNIRFTLIDDWKLYYRTRNHLLMYRWNELHKYRIIIWYITKFQINIIIFNKKQLKMFWKGYIDGILGRSGIKIRP